ncbi:MAG TPA: 23S rRNA (cytosine(1962)-C(5))-methyltransferase RlmI, partial [Candidatus Latescibacteria bacterium]|nr:23S rRNA (cytosine(1962)-C(5))-methyltransferase RlmI [Candidatus Latescibacterota bacterium]
MADRYPEVKLKRGRERQIAEGHPWIFSGAVSAHPFGVEPGGIVDVLDGSGSFVARGY